MLLCLVFFLTYATAVYVGWPLNEQLPDVARVGQEYLFTLASSTFKSSLGGTVSYSVPNLPLWLLFDSQSRSFLGTPTQSDVGKFQITLAGSDSNDNSEYSANYLMVVSDSAGLHLSSADVMLTTIAKYGQTNGRDSLVVKQGESFSIQFSLDVFVMDENASSSVVAYYGRSQNRTSLPNWISFDADSHTFSGKVPYVTSSIAPSIEYGFSFIATDYAGFTGAVGTFKLSVGAHQLSTSLNETIKINGTYGSDFEHIVPVLSEVYLDSDVITRENISSVSAQDLPSYVLFDDNDYTLSGTFPNSTSLQNFSISVQDVYGNLVSLPYTFDSIGSVFTVKTLPDLNATRGDFFLAQLMRSYFTDFNNTSIDVSIPSNSSWLAYHESNMTINGFTPDKFSLAEITVKASSDFDEENRYFSIAGVEKQVRSSLPSSSASSSATSTSSSVAPSGSNAGLSAQRKSSTNRKKLILGLAIGLPLLALLIAALILVLCCCRRRTDKDNESKTHSVQSKADSEELTGPGFGTILSEDDHQETAHRLSKINALKLDRDNQSTLSTLTHVESKSDMEYFDASEKPMLSWRADEGSDSNAVKKMILQKHISDMSAETVNTDHLFSVRLVDENGSARNSAPDSVLGLPGSMDAGPLSSLLNSASSSNIQRLDSDGNIVENDLVASSNVKRHIQGSTTSLNDIVEEGDTNNTFCTQQSSGYNLMAKLLNLKEASLKSQSSIDGFNNGLREEFEPKRGPDGQIIQWGPKAEAPNLASSEVASFLLDSEVTPRNNGLLHSNKADHVTSRTSVYSELSFGSQVDSLAKLVNFTRKASMKDSSRQQLMDHAATSALILDDSESG